MNVAKISLFTFFVLYASLSNALSKRPMSVEDVLALPIASDPQISPDGRWVAYVVTRMNFQKNINDSDIWVVSTAEGSKPQRLTSNPAEDEKPRWAPDSNWLMFVSNRTGSKQLFGIRPDGGELWPITDWVTPIELFKIRPDGGRIGFVAKPKTSSKQIAFEKIRGRPMVSGQSYQDEWSHLWVVSINDASTTNPIRVSPTELFVTRFVWSPSSQSIAFAGRSSPELRSRTEMNVYIVDEMGDSKRTLTVIPGGEEPVAWTDDDDIIVSGTGHVLGTYNRELWKVPHLGGEPKVLTENFDEHAGFVALTNTDLYVEASEKTSRCLFRMGDNPLRISGDSYSYGFTTTEDASTVAFLSETGNQPAEVFVANTKSFKPRKLTQMNEYVRSFTFGEQSVVSWKSRADGESIEGVLNFPAEYEQNQRLPLLLVIHGGPSGVSSNRFSPRRGGYPIQVFTGMGYAVLQPNYRGSTGYGERFRGLNRGDISGRDWVDIDSGVDYLIEKGIVDSKRLGVMGWSFGGHHTFWGITQTDRFRAASAGAGANDLISMYSQTDLPDFYHTYLGPKPWEDFDLYEERSAYRRVATVTTPLLIQVGEKDERVPAEQSIQFYEALRAIGKTETELVIYPDEPHGIKVPTLVRDLLVRNVEWFSQRIPN